MEDTPYFMDLSGQGLGSPSYPPPAATPSGSDIDFAQDNLSRSPPGFMGGSPARGPAGSDDGDGDADDDGQPKKKRQRNSGAAGRNRTTFTKEQTTKLEEIYLQKKYLELDERDVVAEKVGLPAKKVMIWFQNKRMRVKALRKKAGLGPEEIDPDELPTHMQKRNKSDPKGPQVGTEQVMSPGRQVPSPSSFNAPVTSGPGIHNNTMPMPVAPVQNMGPPQNPGIGNQQMTDVHNSVTGNAGFTGMLGDAGGGVEFNNTGVMGNKLQPIGNDLTPSKAQNNPVPLPPMAATNVNQNTAIPSTPAPHQAVNATMNAPMPMNRSPHPKNPPAYNMPQQPPPDYVNNPQAMASLPSPRQLTNEALQFHKQDLKNKIVARSRRLSEASNKSDDSTHSAQPGMNVGSQVPFKTMTTLTSFPTPHHRLGPIAPSGSFPAPIPRPVFTSSPQPPPERFPGHYPYAGEGLLSYLSGMLPPLLPPYQTRPPMVSEST